MTCRSSSCIFEEVSPYGWVNTNVLTSISGGHLPKVAHGTEIAQNLATGCHIHVLRNHLRRRRPHPSLPGDRPPRGTNSEDPENAEGIFDPRLAAILVLFDDLRQRVLDLAFPPASPLVPARGARRPPARFLGRDSIAQSATKQRCRRVWGLGRRAPAAGETVAAGIARLIIETLADEYTVRNTKVHGDRDDDGH